MSADEYVYRNPFEPLAIPPWRHPTPGKAILPQAMAVDAKIEKPVGEPWPFEVSMLYHDVQTDNGLRITPQHRSLLWRTANSSGLRIDVGTIPRGSSPACTVTGTW